MKPHETKMPRMEDILNLPVQSPPCPEFSATLIKWVKVQGGRYGGDDIALIPFARVEDFVKGESSNAECPSRFRVESKRKRPEGSVSKPRVDGYLEYTLYWCSYGPEDYRESEANIRDSSNTKPPSGKGSRPGRRHMMRGCLCHFTVKRLYTRPILALIIYNNKKHVDKNGAPCHGVLDHDAIGTRAIYAPRISEELRQKIMNFLYFGVSLDDIMQHHMEVVQGHGGPHNRDDFLTRNDVRNMERAIRNCSHELHENDECSVKLWVPRHQKHVFFFQDGSDSEPFVLGIQTDWQLQQMIRYGHNSSIASHSTFGLKKLKYSLSSLLVFDACRNAIPVAWIITLSHVGQSITKWMGSLVERIRTKDSRWKPNAFLLDDPSFEISIIREVFQCPVLLCLWHVRRSWMYSLLKRCSNLDVQRDMFKHLGQILYSTRSRQTVVDAIEEFMQIYVDQHTFMDYFRTRWLPKIEWWVNGVKDLPVTSQEHHAAIESYHLRLKFKLFNDQHANSWSRIDWLIHTLTTEFHSLYWFDQYIVETGYFENLKDPSFSINSWYLALHIPDGDVLLDERNLLLARVLSQTDRNIMYTVSNPGSEFSICDCDWSRLGNICKHVIKVGFFCKNCQVARPYLASAQTYRQTLFNLLHNPPEDPIVLDHAILCIARLEQDIKGLEELANSGLLQPLPIDKNRQVARNESI